jgi:anti-sigma factor RsiW
MPLEDQPKQFESLDEELVAYLDGELEPEQAARIDERLATDAVVRERLQHLQRAWDMLDELPQEDVKEQFTETTIGMVVASAEIATTDAKQTAFTRSAQVWSITAVTCLIACFAGYQVVFGIFSAPNERLQKDLEVIENLDGYRSAENVDFLRRLADEGLFDEEVQAAEPD